MEIKLNDVIGARPALERLFSCSPKKAKDTFRLARIQREVQPIVADYEKARVALLEKYASRDPEKRDRFRFIKLDEEGEPVLDEQGNTIKDDEAIAAFAKEHDEELLEEDVEVGQYITLTFIDRIGLDPAMTPAEMAALWWLIKEFGNGASPDDDQEA